MREIIVRISDWRLQHNPPTKAIEVMRAKARELERAIENYFIQQCAKEGIYQRKFPATVDAGMPDRFCAYKGLAFFVELKRGGETLRKLQEWQKEQLENQGVIVHVVDSIEAVDTLIKEVKSHELII